MLRLPLLAALSLVLAGARSDACMLHGQEQRPVDKKHQQDLENDAKRGKEYSEIVEKELKLSKDQAAIDRVQRIGAELSKICNENLLAVTWGDKRLNPFTYTFKVVEGDDVNAFSLPGGYIYIYEGLMKFAESDDELAGVIGHEIAHAAFRHLAVLEREQSKVSVAQIPLLLATILTGGRIGPEFLQLGSLVGQALGSGWSVEAELASDYGGLQLLRKSSYNPVGMLTFMERLAKRDRVAEGAIDWGIYRTHPPSRQRADALIQRLAEANVAIRRSAVSTSFRVQVKETSEIWFAGRKLFKFGGNEAVVRANEAAVELNGFLDEVPALFDLKMDGGTVFGRRERLFEIREDDLALNGGSVDVAKASVLAELRKAIYQVQFKVWDNRG